MSTTATTSTDDSKVLTAETLPAYLVSKASLLPKGLISISHDLKCEPIVGGNMNYAFCVTCKNENNETVTIFVKQAPEYVAIFGPGGFPVTSERMQQEMDVYEEWKTLLKADASTFLPQIYFFDPKSMVVCMEFLDGYELLDHCLVSPSSSVVSSIPIATALGTFMGQTHAATHSSLLTTQERKEFLIKKYENRALRDIQLEFVFTKCYKEATDEQRAGLNVNDDFMKEIELLKEQYNGNGTPESLVLSHGDLHPGSVMVSNDSVKVIDPEFTVYGPPGLDVGSLLSGFVLGAIHQAFAGHAENVKPILEMGQAIWDSYVVALKKGGLVDEALMKSIEIETVGFTVAEVCRTALEFAGGRKWLQFNDAPDTKQKAKKAALSVVDQCMIPRHAVDHAIPLLFSAVETVVKKHAEITV